MYLYLLVLNKSCYLVILVFYIQFILKFHQFVILSKAKNLFLFVFITTYYF